MATSNLPPTFTPEFHNEELCRKMEYRILGRTGLKVSKISLGTETLSSFYEDTNAEEAIATIHKALKSGINYIDTAPQCGLGRTEEVLGMALKDVPRSAYYVATKVGGYDPTYESMFDFSAKNMRESVERSLQLLGLDYVDIIQIHNMDFYENSDIVLNECLPELEKIVKEGKARFIGIAGHNLKALKGYTEEANGKFDIVSPYARYTLCDDSLKSYLYAFQNENMGIVCASPQAYGLLTNDGPQPWHLASDEQKQLCRKAANICKEANIELGKLAMYYSMQLDGVATFLIGIQTCQILDINLEVFYNGLNQKEQEILQLLKDTVFTRSIDWGCNAYRRYLEAKDKKKKLK